MGGIHSPQPQLPWFHIWFHVFGGASFGGALFDLHGQVGDGLCQHVYSGAADGRSRSGGRKFGRERFCQLGNYENLFLKSLDIEITKETLERILDDSKIKAVNGVYGVG